MVARWQSSGERGCLTSPAWEHSSAALNQGSSFYLSFVGSVCSQPFAQKPLVAATGRDTASIYINTREYPGSIGADKQMGCV